MRPSKRSLVSSSLIFAQAGYYRDDPFWCSATDDNVAALFVRVAFALKHGQCKPSAAIACLPAPLS